MVIRAARVLASVLMRATARQSTAVRRNFSARSGMCALYAAQTPQDRIGSALCNRALGSHPEQLDELIAYKAGFDQLQSGLRNVHFGLAVETGAIGPVDPRPPQPGQRAAKAGAWSRVLQAWYVRSRRKLTCEPLAAIQNYFGRAACCAHATAGRGFGWSASS
jgi:hypothetical protein